MVLSRMCIALGAVVGSAVMLTNVGIAWSQGADDELAPQEAHDFEESDDPALAVALPGPNQFVSGLDLECYDTPGPALNLNVVLNHLNPILLQLGLGAHGATIRELQQTCVPVQKNGVSPDLAALPFIRQVDLACYRIETPAIPPTPLTLKHLNPVFANFPVHGIRLLQGVQLCLPVAKNGMIPTPDILQLIQHIDLECFRVEPGAHPVFTVNLKQFNPVLANVPPHNMTLVPTPRQMCVPVRKNNQLIPAAVLNIVRWIDLEKFLASPQVPIPAVNLVLRHLNPLFSTLPQVPVLLQRANALMVPVSKNGAVPPPP